MADMVWVSVKGDAMFLAHLEYAGMVKRRGGTWGALCGIEGEDGALTRAGAVGKAPCGACKDLADAEGSTYPVEVAA